MPNQNQTILIPPALGDIYGVGEHELETVVLELAAAQGVLARGSVLSTAGSGKLVLAAAGNEAQAYGILLDPSIDTAQAFSNGVVTGSIARSGSFKGEKMIVSSGTNTGTLVSALRQQGIFIEGNIIAP